MAFFCLLMDCLSFTSQGYNPLHLASFGGHVAAVGLLLSRAADLLHSADRAGRTCLHIASTHGHYQMVEVLLGQGAEINGTDKVCADNDIVYELLCIVSELFGKYLTNSSQLFTETTYGSFISLSLFTLYFYS